jgi:hypothetical protein
MNPARLLLPFALLSLSVNIPRPLGAAELRPTLQIINGSSQLAGHLSGYDPAKAEARDKAANGGIQRETRDISGWTVHINRALLVTNAAATERALELLKVQLEGIVRVVPPAAVAQLRKVSLWVSPEYPGVEPRAEYHPDARWLREHGRDPAMANGVEFTNLRIFESETKRMPVFVLHELAHAYHDRVLPHGFGNPQLEAAYQNAKASGKYDRVERRDARGRVSLARAYAMTNPEEYFAESTESLYGTNDFFPFTRDELKQFDPAMFALLEKLWNLRSETKDGSQ